MIEGNGLRIDQEPISSTLPRSRSAEVGQAAQQGACNCKMTRRTDRKQHLLSAAQLKLTRRNSRVVFDSLR